MSTLSWFLFPVAFLFFTGFFVSIINLPVSNSSSGRRFASGLVLMLISVAAVSLPNILHAIGSGGLLVHVPYAQIFLDDEEQSDWLAYVHPTEGSWLVIPSQGTPCYGIDKYKRHAISVERQYVKKTKWAYVIDVPEKSPYQVIDKNPVFRKKSASARLAGGARLKIVVDR